MNTLRIIVLGWLIRGPSGGLAWPYLNYVHGLAALGHDVYYIEDSEFYFDPELNGEVTDPGHGLRFASDAFGRLGLGDRWAYYEAHTNTWKGARARDALDLCKTADLILNVSGATQLREWLERIPVRAFIDTDPGLTQILNLTDSENRRRCKSHSVFFSFGENIGKPSSLVPVDGFAWHPTRQPVSIDAWPRIASPHNGRYTTVMSWESLPVREYHGLRFGMKSESFAPFSELPRRLGSIFEIAVRGPTATLSALHEAGWEIADIAALNRDPWSYQAFIQASKAEFGIAKQGYVVTRSGWFSERSAVYLASGRPVLAQDTGFPEWLPCGEGVLVFQSPEEVVDAISRVELDYDAHCRVARQLAEDYFAARRVLPPLIEAAMSTCGAKAASDIDRETPCSVRWLP
jgi:hypothetical protein